MNNTFCEAPRLLQQWGGPSIYFIFHLDQKIFQIIHEINRKFPVWSFSLHTFLSSKIYWSFPRSRLHRLSLRSGLSASLTDNDMMDPLSKCYILSSIIHLKDFMNKIISALIFKTNDFFYLSPNNMSLHWEVKETQKTKKINASDKKSVGNGHKKCLLHLPRTQNF